MPAERGYSSAELPLYFEWHGTPESSQPPLLLLHGGGSTIESNWGRLIPALKSSRRMLAVELQGHGRTGPGSGPASFEGSADGVAALLAELAAGPVDVLGLSNGGQVGMRLASRHPRAVRRLIVASAPFRRDGMADGSGTAWPPGPTPISPSPTAEPTSPSAATRRMPSRCSTSIKSSCSPVLPTGLTLCWLRSPRRRSSWRPTAT
jgi:pimeloyl-ACP methyl ester carboxylesterase